MLCRERAEQLLESGASPALFCFLYRKPSKSTGGSYKNPVPSGWSDGVPTGTQILWASSRIFTYNGESPQQAAWSEPSQMTDTATFEVRYSTAETQPSDPTTDSSAWSATATANAVWMAIRTCTNGSWTGWTITRIKGEKGDTGRSPALVYRGLYDSTKTYYGNANRIDCVKHTDGLYYAARVDAPDGITGFYGKLPTNAAYWNPFGDSFESVATSLLLAENATIENLIVRQVSTSNENKHLEISNVTNAMSMFDDNGDLCASFEGNEYTDEALYSGSDSTVIDANTKGTLTVTTNNQLHANQNYKYAGKVGSTFTTSYPGVVNGTVRLKLSGIGSYTLTADTPSLMFYASLKLYLNGELLGRVDLFDLSSDGISTQDDITFSRSVGISTSNSLTYELEVSNPNFQSLDSYTITANATVTTAVKYTSSQRMSRYFANGNSVGCSNTEYVQTLISDNKLVFRAISGNAGVEVSNGVLRLRMGGTWYTCSRDSSTGYLKLT